MSLPKMIEAWTIHCKKNGFDELKLENSHPISELGEHDCLVKIQAVSLNNCDIIIPQGSYPFPIKTPTSPRLRRRWQRPPHRRQGLHALRPEKPNRLPYARGTASGLGGALDGTLRQYAVFPEDGLVPAPSNVTPTEASTLTCAPLTARNALYGLESKALKRGQTILTEGTGGVSLAAIQFAVAAG